MESELTQHNGEPELTQHNGEPELTQHNGEPELTQHKGEPVLTRPSDEHVSTEKKIRFDAALNITVLDLINYINFVSRRDNIYGLHDKIEYIFQYIKNSSALTLLTDKKSIFDEKLKTYIFLNFKDLTDEQLYHIVDALTNIDIIKKDGEDNGIDYSHIIELFTGMFYNLERKSTVVDLFKIMIEECNPSFKIPEPSTFSKVARYALLPITVPLAFTFGALSGGFRLAKKVILK
jgi:hypothetical protein